MSLLRPMGAQWRAPALGRVLVFSTYRGRLRVQSWPRKRGKPKDRRQRANLRYFALIQRAVKLLQAEEVNDMREALRRHNQRNRGQRGSAAIRMRDWQHQRMTGRGWAITVPGGPIFYPPAVARDASHILDHTSDDEGQFLIRTTENWQCIPPAQAGQLLISDPSGPGASWADL